MGKFNISFENTGIPQGEQDTEQEGRGPLEARRRSTTDGHGISFGRLELSAERDGRINTDIAEGTGIILNVEGPVTGIKEGDLGSKEACEKYGGNSEDNNGKSEAETEGNLVGKLNYGPGKANIGGGPKLRPGDGRTNRGNPSSAAI